MDVNNLDLFNLKEIISSMPIIQALNNLYNASRRAGLTADEHDLLKKCAEQILAEIQPKEAKDDKVVEFADKVP